MSLPLIRALIVEDQPNVRSEIHYLVERERGFIVSGTCGTVKKARQLIDALRPDLLLLDIHLPDGTCFDVLENCSKEIITIFLTSFDKHAIRAIKCGALDYLLKPIDETEFALALNKASQLFPTKAEQINIARSHHKEHICNRLVLRSQDYLQIVEIGEIVYCHSDSGYTTFHLSDGRKITASKILKDYEEVLTEPDFLRTHQSFLVNSNYIDRYSKEGIHLKDGKQIPVATRRKDRVLEFFNRM